MAVIGDILFYRRDHASVADVVRHVEALIPSKVDEFDQRKFDAQTDEQVVRELVGDLKVEPLQVDFDQGDKRVDEISVTVRDVFDGQVQVPGYRLTKSFPFSGDKDLWTFGTGQWGSVMPRGEVRGDRITIGMEVRTNDTESAIQHIASTIDDIKRYLGLQREPLEVLNASLPNKLLPLVQARRSRRGDAHNLLDRF